MEELQEASRLFLARGLNIREINVLRGCLSQLKAGKLAALCRAKVRVLVLSDVLGNDFGVIGSGPFSRAPGSPENAKRIMRKYRLDKDLPAHVTSRILRADTGNSHLRDVPHYLIGSNIDLLEAAEAFFRERGIPIQTFPESLSGEARAAAEMIAAMIRYNRAAKPGVMLFGGETTVSLNKNPGLGGRSQEMALAVLADLKDYPGYALLCAGSDGIDGNTDAAGALVDRQTFLKAQATGLSPEVYLQRHDSYHFHQQCGSLIVTGPSGTNVADIAMVVYC
jgi:glycerate 2-kinase